MSALLEIVDDECRMHLHQGQRRAWHCEKRIVAIIAGTRSGKTSFGPLWLWKEMMRQGPGDYLVAAPTLTLIDRAAGPELKHVFEGILQLGQMYEHPWKFRFTEYGHQKLWGVPMTRPCRIIFGHGEDPESMEAMTAKAAWLDEAGQKKFKFGSWDAVKRRVHIDQGRILITTTPYTLGWLKQEVCDPYERNHNHPDIEVIRFESIANPAFPREEWEKARDTMPLWKFDMFYRGLFTRPPGMIYNCFEYDRNVKPSFGIPSSWPRYVGIDFGGVHTAAVFLAQERGIHNQLVDKFYVYRVYGPVGNRTAKEHIKEILANEPQIPTVIGGAKSEDQWRDQFCEAGLPIHEPSISDVEPGIDRVYQGIKEGKIVVLDNDKRFSGTGGLIDEIQSYSRKLNDLGEPTEDIENKEDYHCCDALRYVCSRIISGGMAWVPGGVDLPQDRRSEIERAPKGLFLEDFPTR